MQYIALLRVINVGGNNKVPMPLLKQCFEQAGFTNVSTYINSGNVIFTSMETDIAVLVQQCEAAIKAQFGFQVVCAIVGSQELHTAVQHAPSWWAQDAGYKYNAIFVLAPKTGQGVFAVIGMPLSDGEKVAVNGQVVFWGAPATSTTSALYKNIVGSEIYRFVTIRNANTTRKLVALTQP